MIELLNFDLGQLLLGFIQTPFLVYAIIFDFLLTSSFGLPLPEEILIVAFGALAYFVIRDNSPELTKMTASMLHPFSLAGVTFASVFLSYEIFLLTKIQCFFSPRIKYSKSQGF